MTAPQTPNDGCEDSPNESVTDSYFASRDPQDTLPFPSLEAHPLTPGRDDCAEPPTTKSTRSYSFEDLRPEAQESLRLSDSSRNSSIISFLGNYEMPQVEPHKAAGNKSTDHYKSRMAPWRYKMRSAMLPLIRWETPHLAHIQKTSRNIWLDVFFAMSANLGTHTFYVIMLPVVFWFGVTDLARGLVFVLAYGVYLTGVIKDLLCLPRPLSPPLHRITMSGSAALEYGFPSTHTANAVSVTLLFLERLYMHKDDLSTMTFECLRALCFVYGFSIVLGRIYCGMHGFLDVVCGGIIGFFLWWVRFAFGDLMDSTTTAQAPYALLAIPLALILVRVHPEPVDSCPCFDDGVAFMGVLMGIDVGIWMYGKTRYATGIPIRGAIAYNFEDIGVVKSVLRVIVGIMIVLVWRAMAKPLMHKYLPPFFRIIEKVGLSMPRRFFLSASEYKDVPDQIPDTTLIEPHEIPSLIHKIGHARRDSVGPQSAADVFETIAYAEYQRRKSEGVSHRGQKTVEDEKVVIEEQDMLASIPPPRVRYDVEVVTKLIVYSGIGFLSMFAGAFFQVLGLGVNPERLGVGMQWGSKY